MDRFMGVEEARTHLGRLIEEIAASGEPVSLRNAPAGQGASWGKDGNIVAALDTRSGL